MTKLLQTLMDAIAVGSLYALIALGYTMVYGVLQFINFAHGDVFMLGAWLAYTVGTAKVLPAALARPGLGRRVLLVAGVGVVICAAGYAAAAWLAGLPARLRGFLRGTSLAGVILALAVLALVAVLTAGGGAVAALGGAGGTAAASQGRMLLIAGIVLLSAIAACSIIGFTIERIAYRPLRGAPRLNVLITAIGVSLFLENVGQLDALLGTSPQRMPDILPDAVLGHLAGVEFHLVDALVVLVALAFMGGLEWLVFRSKFGLAMRAVSFDPRIASLLGVPVNLVISLTFVIGSALAAAAGFLYVAKYPGLNQPAAATWILLGLKAFVAAVVGGIGNIRGAMLGGLLIGLIELFGAAYVSPALRDVYVFSILIVVLLLKPSGVLGRATVEKV